MLQFWGTFLVAIGVTAVGFLKASQSRLRVRELQTASAALEELARELRFRQPPLKRLLRNAQSPLLQRCAVYLDGERTLTVQEAWGMACDALGLFNEAELAALSSVGMVLGRFSIEEQCKCIDAAQQELHQAYRLAQEESLRSGKVFRTLGLAAGAFVFILLL